MFNFSQFGFGSGDQAVYSYIPGRSLRDAIRSLIGDKGQLLDVDGAPVWILSDQEIDGNLRGYAFAEALALCCDSCQTAIAREPDKFKAGSSDAEAEWNERIGAWRSLAFKARHGYITAPELPEPRAHGDQLTNAIPWPGIPGVDQFCEGQPGSIEQGSNFGRQAFVEQQRR